MINYRDDARWTVYIHIVPKEISGYDYDKYYVGITSKHPMNRWRNGYGYKTQSYFWNAIQKYNWNNILHEIVAEKLTKDEACNLEQSLIKNLKSNDKKHGYNLTNGGNGVEGYKFTKEQLKKMSDQRKGELNSFFGKHHTDEVKQKMSKNHYDCSGVNNPKAKPIYRFDIDFNFIEKFPSATDANKILGISSCGYAALNGCLCMDSYWAREENIDLVNSIPILKQEFKEKILNKKVVITKVVNVTNNELFSSLAEAAKSYEVNYSNIAKAAKEYFKGKNRKCKNYYWLLYKDYLQLNNLTDEEARRSLFFVA